MSDGCDDSHVRATWYFPHFERTAAEHYLSEPGCVRAERPLQFIARQTPVGRAGLLSRCLVLTAAAARRAPVFVVRNASSGDALVISGASRSRYRLPLRARVWMHHFWRLHANVCAAPADQRGAHAQRACGRVAALRTRG